MENLEEIGRKRISFRNQGDFVISACCYDSKIACIVTERDIIGICTTDRGFEWYNGISGKCGNTVTHINYLRNIDAVCVADNHALFIYDYDKDCILGEVEIAEEIVAISWNPMQTVLLVVTKSDKIKLYHLDGTTLSFQREEFLDVNAPQVNDPSGAYKRQKRPLPIFGPPQISWTDNSKFVVNYLSNTGGRIIKIFNIGLTPVIRTVNNWGLEFSLAVNSSGQQIASCITAEEDSLLMIFDNQCYLYSQTILRWTSYIEKMIFHPSDPKVLAIHHVDDGLNNYIDIYMHYMNKWYLKQQLYYPIESYFRGFDWGGTQDFPLYTLVVFTDRNVIHYTFRSVFSRSINRASVGVIDGGILDVCLYEDGLMPPPGYSYRFSHQCPINRVLFHPFKSVCILIDSHMSFIVVEYFKILTEAIYVEGVDSYRFHHVEWANRSEIFIYLEGDQPLSENFIVFNMRVVICCINNSVYKQYILPVEVSSYESKTFVTYEKDIDHIYTMSVVTRDKTMIEFAIGRNRDLYINKELVCLGVTSLYQHAPYIFFTHENRRVYCVRTEDLDEFTANKKLELLFSSAVTKGSKLFVVIPATVPSILLSIPRGSLEIVNCRLITVDRIITMLKLNSWKMAISTVKQTSIDPSILIHVNPQQFLDTIDTVICEADVETFIKVVQNFDIKRNLFDAEPKLWDKMVDTGTDLSQKDIIDAILRALEECDDKYRIKAAAVIKFKHKSIKDSLDFLWTQFSQDVKGHNRALLGETISRLIGLDDVKSVVKTANLLLDIHFLEFVYKQTSDDPAHYEKKIRDLSDLSPLLRNFTMLRDGGDMAGAVKYMIQYENFSPDEIKKFVEEHSVQRAAYNSVDIYSPHFQLLSELFSNYLSKLNQHSCAGFVLRKAGLDYEAIQEYIKANDYYEVIGLLDGIETSERSKVIQQTAARLVRSKKIDEAVMLLTHYNHDIDQAIKILVQENCYRKAMALVKRHKLNFPTGLEVICDARNYVKNLLMKFEEMNTTILHHVNRLSAIRKSRRTQAENSLNSAFEQDQFELASVLSTTSFGSSAEGSTVSSRNRKKLLRKKRDTRPGSKYEDIALIRELYEMFSSIGMLGRIIVDICLIPETELPEAKIAYKQCIDLHKTMIEFTDQIWPDILSSGQQTTNEVDLAVILNRDDLEEQYRKPPPEIFKMDWYTDLY